MSTAAQLTSRARPAVAAASVLGREHARLGRNNQDGYAVRAHGELLVAVVTDGCSAGRYSEVGARLGAAYLAEEGLRRLRRDGEADERFRSGLTSGLVRFLGGLARSLCGVAGQEAKVVHDYLLFGFLCLVVGPTQAQIFGLGDGAYALDGVVTAIDPGPENAPSYAAYALLDAGQLRGTARRAPQLHAAWARDERRSCAIATDGAAELAAHAAEPLRDGTSQGDLGALSEDLRWARNPTLLQKRLSVIGELHRRLRDDTTIIALREEVA